MDCWGSILYLHIARRFPFIRCAMVARAATLPHYALDS
jgi:hypothetical protein